MKLNRFVILVLTIVLLSASVESFAGDIHRRSQVKQSVPLPELKEDDSKRTEKRKHEQELQLSILLPDNDTSTRTSFKATSSIFDDWFGNENKSKKYDSVNLDDDSYDAESGGVPARIGAGAPAAVAPVAPAPGVVPAAPAAEADAPLDLAIHIFEPKTGRANLPAAPSDFERDFSDAGRALRTYNACETAEDFVTAFETFWAMEGLFDGNDSKVQPNKALLKDPKSRVASAKTSAEEIFTTVGSGRNRWYSPMYPKQERKASEMFHANYSIYMIARLIFEINDYAEDIEGQKSDAAFEEFARKTRELLDPLSVDIPGGFSELDQRLFKHEPKEDKDYSIWTVEEALRISPFLFQLSKDDKFSPRYQILNHPHFQPYLEGYKLKPWSKDFCQDLNRKSLSVIEKVKEAREQQGSWFSFRLPQLGLPSWFKSEKGNSRVSESRALEQIVRVFKNGTMDLPTAPMPSAAHSGLLEFLSDGMGMMPALEFNYPEFERVYPKAAEALKKNNACETGIDLVDAYDAFWSMATMYMIDEYTLLSGSTAVELLGVDVGYARGKAALSYYKGTGTDIDADSVVRLMEHGNEHLFAKYMVARFIFEISRHIKEKGDTEALKRIENLMNPYCRKFLKEEPSESKLSGTEIAESKKNNYEGAFSVFYSKFKDGEAVWPEAERILPLLDVLYVRRGYPILKDKAFYPYVETFSLSPRIKQFCQVLSQTSLEAIRGMKEKMQEQRLQGTTRLGGSCAR